MNAKGQGGKAPFAVFALFFGAVVLVLIGRSGSVLGRPADASDRVVRSSNVKSLELNGIGWFQATPGSSVLDKNGAVCGSAVWDQNSASVFSVVNCQTDQGQKGVTVAQGLGANVNLGIQKGSDSQTLQKLKFAVQMNIVLVGDQCGSYCYVSLVLAYNGHVDNWWIFPLESDSSATREGDHTGTLNIKCKNSSETTEQSAVSCGNGQTISFKATKNKLLTATYV
eukprot:Nk52_evm1s180 gene=Nk52_evmTU1s180